MALLKKLFGKKDSKTASPLQAQQTYFQEKAQSKERSSPITEKELMQIFATYFAPNTDFFSVPGSAKYAAYFKVIHAATDELVSNPNLFTAATKWAPQKLVDLLNDPKPSITSMLICGLIFSMGNYAVIKDAIYCVDFCERIPNCIAIFLLLIAQKQPADRRKFLIDAGDGCDSSALTKAMDTLKVCDPSWHYRIG